MPNPFNASIDARAWRHYMDCVEHEASKVARAVSSGITIAGSRSRANGLPEKRSLSDVDRAVKRLDAWANVMLRMIERRHEQHALACGSVGVEEDLGTPFV